MAAYRFPLKNCGNDIVGYFIINPTSLIITIFFVISVIFWRKSNLIIMRKKILPISEIINDMLKKQPAKMDALKTEILDNWQEIISPAAQEYAIPVAIKKKT